MIAAIRKRICSRCRAACPVRHTIDLADVTQECPEGRWRSAQWRDAQRPPVPALPRNPQARRAPPPRHARGKFNGAHIWRMIHAADRWDDRWLAMLPCGECRQHTRAYLESNPPPEGREFIEWANKFHASVRLRLGQPEFLG
jgi:hypothetical protein